MVTVRATVAAMRKSRPLDGAPRARQRLSEEDIALWRHATRADVRLPGRDLDDDSFADETDAMTDVPGAKPDVGRGDRPPALAARPPRQATLPPLQAGRIDGVDKRTAQRLRRGQIAIEARLDLHGLTQAEAHHALNGFLGDAQAAGKRGVLVITGKGRADQGYGVLRRAVPHWLNLPHNRGRIIAVHDAQPRDGGSGALYVLLKKRR